LGLNGNTRVDLVDMLLLVSPMRLYI